MRLCARIVRKFVSRVRRSFYDCISTNKIHGSCKKIAPVLCEGLGHVQVGEGTAFGYAADAEYWNGYDFLNPRTKVSFITIGRDCQICNCFNAIAEGPGIEIGDRVLIGSSVSIYDSDFHEISPEHRVGGTPKVGKVSIGNNVWIGDRVTILKGSSIGENSVIAAGAVVAGKFPANVIIGGVPAKIIRQI